MTPVDRSQPSAFEVWATIRYLDPDAQFLDIESWRNSDYKKPTRRKRILLALISLTALASALAVRYSHVIARLIS